jgi:hypothetical protein
LDWKPAMSSRSNWAKSRFDWCPRAAATNRNELLARDVAAMAEGGVNLLDVFTAASPFVLVGRRLLDPLMPPLSGCPPDDRTGPIAQTGHGTPGNAWRSP